MTIEILILGAAAGGGLPQWNCGCANCALARAGRDPRAEPVVDRGQRRRPRLGDAERLARHPRPARPPRAALHPTGPRASPVRAVLLTNGDIDHVAGPARRCARSSRSRCSPPAAILAVLAANPIFGALDPGLVRAAAGARSASRSSSLPGLTAELFAVPGKVPLYLEGETVATDLEGEQTVGVRLGAGGARAFYVPGCAGGDAGAGGRGSRGAALVFFDGTLWEDDEMIRAGLGTKTGRRMGHMPMSGPRRLDGGACAARDRRGRSTCTSTTPTRPCDPGRPERAAAEAAGWEIAARRHGDRRCDRRRARPSRRGCGRIGAERYHDRHPFHHRLHSGGCTPDQVRAWVINRFYYQSRIPMKDAAFMSRVEDPDLRRAWRSADRGPRRRRRRTRAASARWLRLAEAVGLDPAYVASTAGVHAGDPLRRRRLRALRARADAARGGGRVADRALRPDDPRRAHRGAARALRLRRRARACPISATG